MKSCTDAEREYLDALRNCVRLVRAANTAHAEGRTKYAGELLAKCTESGNRAGELFAKLGAAWTLD